MSGVEKNQKERKAAVEVMLLRVGGEDIGGGTCSGGGGLGEDGGWGCVGGGGGCV